MKKNCWEFKKCGREPGGLKTIEFGVCPAAREIRLNGIHGGRNAGRACWVVAGTLCHGDIQGTFQDKYKNCSACGFYREVRAREFPRFTHSITLLGKIKPDKTPGGC